MPVALTGAPIVQRHFTANTASLLIENVVQALVFVGWISSTVTNGYKLQCVSPQGLNVFLYIRSLGHRFSLSFEPTITLNFETLDGTVTGVDQEIEISGANTYQLVAGCCYLALGNLVSSVNTGGGNFIGGIPFVPDAAPCGEQIPALSVNQAFWSMGDYGGIGYTPRQGLITNGQLSHSEALWNDIYSPPGDPDSSVRFPTLTPAPSIAYGFNFPSCVEFYNPDLFYRIEPLLVWGLEAGHPLKIRAQAWDAMLFCKRSMPMDVITESDDHDWLCWSDAYLFAGLHLLVPAKSLHDGNTAWIAT
jgi:hypothetical protein